MGPGETNHEVGRAAVYLVKRWLESTTRCMVPWTVYENPNLTTLPDLDGTHDSYDLCGYFAETRSPFYAEVKKYADASDLSRQYSAYLAHSYSATKRMLSEGPDKCWEFMWITWHPFYVTQWKDLCSPSRIERALQGHPGKLGGEDLDSDVAKLLSSRLWLLVLSDRHEELIMSAKYLGHIRQLITMGRHD